MTQKTGKKILIAPLDWGLGHTTRCVPLIGTLQALGHNVIFAGTEGQLAFIKNIYTGIETTALPGYNITYGSGDNPGKLQPLLWLPKINKAIKQEREWIMANAHRLGIDGIISDNRYGLYHRQIPNVILTHQLNIQTGIGEIANMLMRKLHYQLLEKFDNIWVPDVKGATSLAGALSQPATVPANTTYIGWLSQLQAPLPRNTMEHLLVLLSGPEPQRSILETRLLAKLKHYNGKVVFAGGKTSKGPRMIPANITYYDMAAGKQLKDLVMNAHTVICRSGYSTLMDLQLARKAAILIPTPGQTEQEYLAKHLAKRPGFAWCKQEEVHKIAIPDAGTIPTPNGVAPGDYRAFEKILRDWCEKL